MEVDDKSDPGAWERELQHAPWLRERMQVRDTVLREHFRTEEGETVDIETTGTYQAITVSCDESA